MEIFAGQLSADQATAAAAKDALTIADTVLNTEDSIILPTSVSGYSRVSVSWSSGDTPVIAADGTVTIPDGTETTTVTLTATIRKGDVSLTRTFTVAVYQLSKVLADADYVAAAKSRLSVAYTDSVYADQAITLPAEVSVGEKSVSVTWTATSDTTHHALDSGKTECTIHRDIADVTGTLSATLAYGSASDSTTVSVTIGRVSKIRRSYTSTESSYSDSESYTFDGKTMTYVSAYTSGGISNTSGKKYSYTVDTANKTLTVTTTAASDGGKWYSKSEYSKNVKNVYSATLAAMKAFVKNPSLDTLLAEMQIQFPSITKEYAENMLVQNYASCFNNVTTVEEFEALPAQQLRTGFEVYCEATRAQAAATYGLSSEAGWDSIFSAYSASLDATVKKIVDEAFVGNKVYTYSVDTVQNDNYENGLELVTAAQWVEGREWYEQDYSHSSYGGYDSAGGVYWDISIDIENKSASITYNDAEYEGSFDDTFSQLTDTESGIIWTVTEDSQTHELTFTKENSTDSFTVKLNGESLN